MSGWNVYTSQSAVWMISSITDGNDANAERDEDRFGLAPLPLAGPGVWVVAVPLLMPSAAVGEAARTWEGVDRASSAKGERANELNSGESSIEA